MIYSTRSVCLPAALLAAILAAACGGGAANSDTEFDLHVAVASTNGGTGRVTVAGDPNDCVLGEGNCDYVVNASDGTTVTAVPGADSTFVGWSGDCSGTDAAFVVNAAAGAAVSCTATFDLAAAAGPSREGILTANRQTCTVTAAPGFDCNVAPGGSFNVNAPSATLDAALVDANPYCYAYLDVTDFSSEDHGVVTLVTSQISATATWGAGAYNFTGLTGAPFAATDSVAITTSGGTVDVAAPPQPTLVDDPTNGLQLEITGTADSVRLVAFGYDPSSNAFGVLCRFPFTNPAPVSNPLFVSAIASVSGGAVPSMVLAGFGNQSDITGWDTETRLGEAVRWFQLAGPTLDAMGELQ